MIKRLLCRLFGHKLFALPAGVNVDLYCKRCGYEHKQSTDGRQCVYCGDGMSGLDLSCRTCGELCPTYTAGIDDPVGVMTGWQPQISTEMAKNISKNPPSGGSGVAPAEKENT